MTQQKFTPGAGEASDWALTTEAFPWHFLFRVTSPKGLGHCVPLYVSGESLCDALQQMLVQHPDYSKGALAALQDLHLWFASRPQRTG